MRTGGIKESTIKQVLGILDFDPLTEKDKLDDEALKDIITNKPQVVKNQFQFQCYKKKLYPVVMACLLGSSNIQRMQELFPRARQLCPLVAILTKATIEEFQKALLSEPDLIHDTIFGTTYLHIAIEFSAGLMIIQRLVEELHPKLVNRKNSFGRTPLFLACLYDVEFEIFQLVIDRSPKAVGVLDNQNISPLQIASAKPDASLAIVEWLYMMWPNANTICNKEGMYPIHSACAANAPIEIIKFLVEKNPELLTNKVKSTQIPYFIAKEALEKLGKRERDDRSEVILYLGTASFYSRLMDENKNECVKTKMNDLIPLVCDVNVLRIFYTFVSTSWKLGQIKEDERKKFIKASLEEGACKTRCPRSTAIFKMVLRKARKDAIISELAMEELDQKAEVKHIENAAFVKDMWHNIDMNTARINRLEDAVDRLSENVQSLHTGVNRLRDAMIQKEKVESGMAFMKLILGVVAMAGVADAMKSIMTEIVDFSDIGEIKEAVSVNCASSLPLVENAESAAMASVESATGNFDIANFMNPDHLDVLKLQTESERLCFDEKVWGGVIFSLSLGAVFAANKDKIRESLNPLDFTEEISIQELPFLANSSFALIPAQKDTIAQRVSSMEKILNISDPNPTDQPKVCDRIQRLEHHLFDDHFMPCSDLPTGRESLIARVQALETFISAKDQEGINQQQEEPPVEPSILREEQAKATALELRQRGTASPENHADEIEHDDAALSFLMEMGFETGRASVILKRCDNRGDVALNHLLAGTSLENIPHSPRESLSHSTIVNGTCLKVHD
eukprot:CAMPEP_0113326864 /NCGR_PEP_ID=MMETSP0010_2-20120614/18845_1 /TAXON_ID=216773 ORGANISM="Corethron hystrix, Strain 308" /NCGR_SAMPLE_ID=MMETSP0010_2 /ASSEMBLY_ACC=CAM_ASM_000155 /LENGTH=793 /DNA_ID=CAMNT_0000187417 /DNA_START=616 /DNA_END=2997 /DNA_ORIENTATION=- /assembly_acc=CAM_ASM_000155